MIRTYGAASSGSTSGLGLAIANTIASPFIFASASAGSAFAPGDADQQVGALDHVRRGRPERRSGLVTSASQRLTEFIDPSR